MSKDIWHKPIETTDVDNNLIIDDWTNRTYELGYFDDKDMIFRNLRNDDTYFEESMMRWCDVNELIDDYDRTRKALDVAVDALKEQQRWFGVIRVSLISHLNNEYGTLFKSYDADPTVVNIKRANDILNRALEQIGGAR